MGGQKHGEAIFHQKKRKRGRTLRGVMLTGLDTVFWGTYLNGGREKVMGVTPSKGGGGVCRRWKRASPKKMGGGWQSKNKKKRGPKTNTSSYRNDRGARWVAKGRSPQNGKEQRQKQFIS